MFRKIAASLLIALFALFAGAATVSASVEPDQAPVCAYHTETKRPIEVPCAQPYGATPAGIQMNSGEFCPLGSYVTADLNWCLSVETVTGGWSAYDDGTVNQSEIPAYDSSVSFEYEPDLNSTPSCTPDELLSTTGECIPLPVVGDTVEGPYAPLPLAHNLMDQDGYIMADVRALEGRVSMLYLYTGLLSGLLVVTLFVLHTTTRQEPLKPSHKK